MTGKVSYLSRKQEIHFIHVIQKIAAGFKLDAQYKQILWISCIMCSVLSHFSFAISTSVNFGLR
jgi:hypothetical protein